MAKEKQDKAQNQNNNQNQNQNIVSMPQKCKSEGCKQKDQRMGFCNEHFVWYKEGLITAKGQMVKDFDKKFQAFMHRKVS